MIRNTTTEIVAVIPSIPLFVQSLQPSESLLRIDSVIRPVQIPSAWVEFLSLQGSR
jgi:hypothetical protein